MATYITGENIDEVIKTTEESNPLDLTVFIAKFVQLRDAIASLPKVKTEPDAETLEHWMNTIYDESREYKAMIDVQILELYKELTAIRDAKLLPSKYETRYQQLKTYVENL